MARPRKKLPSGGHETIRNMAANGAKETEIAAELGLNWRTFRRIKNEDEAAADALAEGRAREHDELVGLLLGKARQGDAPSAMFLLKARHGYREQGPADGAGEGARVQINLPTSTSPDQWERMVNVTPGKVEGSGNE